MPRALSVYNTTSRAQRGANYLPGRLLLPKPRREYEAAYKLYFCEMSKKQRSIVRSHDLKLTPLPKKQEAEIPSCYRITSEVTVALRLLLPEISPLSLVI